MLSVLKMLLKGEVGGHLLNSHGSYIFDHGNSWKNHGIVLLNFCGNPVNAIFFFSTEILVQTQVMEHQIDYKQKYKALKKKLKFLVYVSMHLQIRGIRT